MPDESQPTKIKDRAPQRRLVEGGIINDPNRDLNR